MESKPRGEPFFIDRLENYEISIITSSEANRVNEIIPEITVDTVLIT